MNIRCGGVCETDRDDFLKEEGHDGVVDSKETRGRGPWTRTDQRVMFRVASLWGFSEHGLQLRLSDSEVIDTKELYSTLDPHADPDSNVGVVDFERNTLSVRYGFQVVCPHLYETVIEYGLDPALLIPMRVLNAEECTLNPDLAGWQAKGVTETLPGGNPLIGIGGG